MAVNKKEVKDAQILMLECKECHRPVTQTELVAYHLVDRVLYGWCQSCFKARSARDRQVGSLVAAVA
ncbi:MAG TPA: hypothetical protein VGV87_24325 [Blastocatellia bacterium]|jgi:hypothetical protein|nr:hypothetical protein [Blastocatellia bacterium]